MATASGLPTSHNPKSALPIWRNSQWLAFAEFAVVALVFVADFHHLIPLSKTPFLLAIGWISLRIRNVSWPEVGFTRNQSWGKILTLGIGGGLLLELFQLFVTQPFLARLTGHQPDLSDFAILKGNVKYTLIGLALAWTLAAFGEELVWRGYLMNRFADIFRRTRLAWICSLLLVNAVFGLAHSNQGLTGMIEESI